MEEKKTESERNKDERQQNKKWIESLGFENLLVEKQTKNGWRIVKNDEKSSRNCSQKCLESITEEPRLGFSSTKHVFSPKTA